MKKFLALILAAAMLCTMTTVIASAVSKPLVGNNAGDGTTDDGTYTDGLAADKNFPAAGNYNVEITATAGSVEHRYAVDITYDDLSFNVTASKMVWNVNTLQYEVKDGGEALSDKKFNVAITNKSDLPIYATVAVSDLDDRDGATVAAYEDESTTTKLSAGKITIEDAVNLAGTENVLNFDVTITTEHNTPEEWNAVSNYYAGKFTAQGNDTPITMGTMSITLSKS